jgi:hypothetical protein
MGKLWRVFFIRAQMRFGGQPVFHIMPVLPAPLFKKKVG